MQHSTSENRTSASQVLNGTFRCSTESSGTHFLSLSGFQKLHKEWDYGSSSLSMMPNFTTFEERKGFHAFGTIQACGISRKVQISHLSAERGAWVVGVRQSRAVLSKRKNHQTFIETLLFFSLIFIKKKQLAIQKLPVLIFTWMTIIYLVIGWLSNRKRNARNPIHWLQQETKWVVVNYHNSA